MGGGTRTLTIARRTVRVLWLLNIASAIAFVVAIALSFPFAGRIASHLIGKYGAGVDAGSVIAAVRLMLAAGIVAAGTLHVIFTNLLAVLATVRIGDPFTAANAQRLRRIGWALLVFQILHLSLGGFTAWLSALHVRTASWSPDIAGWVAVVMVFVLAGVFSHGAAMRDDLAMTI